MTTFNVSLRTPGDDKGLPVSVRLENRKLVITAGEHEIGEWPLSDVELEPTGTGYRITAEGESIILDFESVSAFERELAEATKGRTGPKRRLGRGKKPKPKKAPKAEVAQQTDREPVTTARTEPEAPSPTPSSSPRTTRMDKPEGGESFKDKALRLLDNLLASAEEKGGALLPTWVFTRGTAAAFLILLVLAVIFPGLASSVLFILGVIVVIFGAIAYSDNMVASRWLPGRSTPTHALITGVVLILLGVGFAVLAR